MVGSPVSGNSTGFRCGAESTVKNESSMIAEVGAESTMAMDMRMVSRGDESVEDGKGDFF